MAEHNLFESLLSLHSSSAVVPAENFLTEVFAHFLRTDPACRDAWLSLVLARPFVGEIHRVSTRAGDAASQGNGTLFPDMTISGTCGSTGNFVLIAEHKWASPCSPDQLHNYLTIAEREDARLVFVAPTQRQLRDAAPCLPGGRADCFGWWQVYTAFKAIPQKSPLLEMFLEFMEAHGLAPVQALQCCDVTAPTLLDTLKKLSQALLHDHEWSVLPDRFRTSLRVSTKVGRVGIEFDGGGWKPGVVVGFLHDPKDFKVSLVKSKQIDLIVRIEAKESAYTFTR